MKTAAVVAGAAAVTAFVGRSQEGRDYGPDASPVIYPDPDIVSVTPALDLYRIGNSAIQLLWTGGLWLKGAAWNGVGRFFLWSDIRNDRQHRWLEDNGEVSVFRSPSGYSNGSTSDWEDRKISCQHGRRQIVRYEHDGTPRLSTPTAGSGSRTRRTEPRRSAAMRAIPARFTPARGLPHRSLRPGRARHGRVRRPERTVLLGRLYAALRRRPWGRRKDHQGLDIVDETSLANMRVFTDVDVDGTKAGPDAVRSDIDGNVWATVTWTGYVYIGVHCFTPEGERIGHIKLPKTTANLVFGGPKRNRLMITASQSIYVDYVNTRGAHIT